MEQLFKIDLSHKKIDRCCELIQLTEWQPHFIPTIKSISTEKKNTLCISGLYGILLFYFQISSTIYNSYYNTVITKIVM